MARSSSNSENQLVLMWSSMEVLFGDPPSGSRISFYEDAISACLCLNYPWRNILAVFRQINNHHRTSLRNSIDDAGISSDLTMLERFTKFFFDPIYAEHHPRFFSQIASNPLACNRLYVLYKKFENRKSAMASVLGHEQRVRWQIRRIYRARNAFIHAGEVNKYVQPLALNCFEYFRTSLEAIIYSSAEVDFQEDCDYFINLLRINYRMKMSDLSGFSEPVGLSETEGHLRFLERTQ